MSSKDKYDGNLYNVFDVDTKYKLYRNMYEVIHPTISKKNISNYKIVLDEEIAPLRIFYPDKVSSINSIIIFIHGDPIITNCVNAYDKICKKISSETGKLVIALDYKSCREHPYPASLDECYSTILYLYKELANNGISEDQIVLMGDSIGATLAVGVIIKARNMKTFAVRRSILVYPILEWNKKLFDEDILLSNKVDEFFKFYNSGNNSSSDDLLYPLKLKDYSNFPITLTIVGKGDIFRMQGIEFYNNLVKINKENQLADLTFADHGFLNSTDSEVINSFYSVISDFLTF